jgi:hypothetical protein
MRRCGRLHKLSGLTTTQAAKKHGVIATAIRIRISTARRATFVRSQPQHGCPRKKAMDISGHRTLHVFDRYCIVSDRRPRQNGEKLAAHLKAVVELNSFIILVSRAGLEPNAPFWAL